MQLEWTRKEEEEEEDVVYQPAEAHPSNQVRVLIKPWEVGGIVRKLVKTLESPLTARYELAPWKPILIRMDRVWNFTSTAERNQKNL